ncbi:DNA polymerase III subunit chi [Acidimangrovimonas sediminis]|uniref:DNA polymerase III subunit chi n=1 Tax=Acidimangrovimonas sediminis TaxID=2056283 RepID=UPI000C803CF2|nr:DNA polymerase III subunit chi [Acidimangrovimonas sediminis]
MGAARFYHLTDSSVDQALALLVPKSLEAGWRVAVRGTDEGRLRWLDDRLWLGPEEGFLPHGLAGGPHDADQPVLLTTAATSPNGAACLMAIDGAEVTAAEIATLERVCILFDGANPDALSRARVQWKSLTDAGASAQYWSEEQGRWQMKAER